MGDGGHNIGLPGADIHSQDHICALFDGEAQRDEILFPFLQAGLDDGDKCVLVLDHDEPRDVLGRFADAATLDGWTASGALDVRGAAPADPDARALVVDEMLANWDDAVTAAQAGSEFDFVRVTGDATWWGPRTDVETLVSYESELNHYIPDRMAVLCLYDVSRCESALLIDAVRTHPRLLVGSVVIENPYYLPPADLEIVRRTPEPAEGPSDYEIHQLAHLPRVDFDAPRAELVCGGCGLIQSVASAELVDGGRAKAFRCPRCGGAGTSVVDASNR
jgi:hypothetical protein